MAHGVDFIGYASGYTYGNRPDTTTGIFPTPQDKIIARAIRWRLGLLSPMPEEDRVKWDRLQMESLEAAECGIGTRGMGNHIKAIISRAGYAFNRWAKEVGDQLANSPNMGGGEFGESALPSRRVG